MVGLMQEPVAAVMSVMRKRKSDGIFVVYDLGGGTLDVAIAQFRARADQFGPRGHSFMSTQLWEPLKQIDPEIVHGFEKMHHRNDAPSLDLDENAVNAITENPSVIGKQRAAVSSAMSGLHFVP